jgi:steroid delta-isomerase-like uncharacterized protein
MTSDEIRAFLNAHVQAWTSENVDALTRNYSDDCEITSPMFHTVRGKAALGASLRDLFRGLRQWSVTIDDLIVDRDADAAVMLLKFQAVHAGEMFGFPATGRRVEVNAAHLYHFSGGVISSEKRLYDFSGLLMQLGVLKAKAG